MHTVIMTLDNLRQICPVEVERFVNLCEELDIENDTAIEVIAEDDPDFLDDPEGLPRLVAAFEEINDAFQNAVNTRDAAAPVHLEAHFNDDEMESYGAYIRVANAVVLNPLLINFRSLLRIESLLTVFKPSWDEETKATGL